MIYLVFLLLLGILTTRLFVLSRGNLAQEILSGQYTRKYEIASFRGFLYDRNKTPIEGQQTGYVAFVNPSKVKSSVGYASSLLSAYTDTVSESELYDMIQNGVPFKLSVKEEIQNEWVKSFPLYERGKDTAVKHILGYINADGVGASGLEKVYNQLLSGRLSGTVYARYEANAKKTALNGEEPVICDDGYSQKNGIVLTIDKDLQTKTEEIADRYVGSGAIVVSDITNGEILATVSRPAYDSNNIGKYLSSGGGEFLNRALCAFTPGSIFKIIVAASALETDSNLYQFQYDCTGKINVAGEIFHCHKTDGHGVMNMKEAFANSCNTYFITLAQKTGYAKILEMARRIGIENKIDLDGLPCQSGSLPNNSVVPPALVANTAIGQGSILLTPLEATKMISAAATGKVNEPSLVKSMIINGTEEPCEKKEPTVVWGEDITAKLKEMISACVENGTGVKAKPKIGFAGGKTATAQTGQMKNGVEMTNLWFAGVYPQENPSYAIVVLCDANGNVEGPRSPQDAFREICDYLGSKVG
jgi:Cell division protein FtsI/penicillin-binding protein 2